MRFKWSELRIAALISTAAVMAAAPAANADFQGENGKIAFSGFIGDNQLLYTANADGTSRQPLTTSPTNTTTYDYTPRWSADGQKIVFEHQFFAAAGNSYGNEIRVVNANGSGNTVVLSSNAPNLPFDPSTRFKTPSFSPDRSKIVFAAIPNDGSGHEDLWSMNATGGNLQQITSTPTEIEGSPVLSGDGTALAYTRHEAKQIVVANVNGSNPSVVASGIRPDGRADWSPTSTHLVFEGQDASRHAGVWTVSRTGTSLTRIVAGPSASDGHVTYNPAWAPDGASILRNEFNGSFNTQTGTYQTGPNDGVVRDDFNELSGFTTLVPYGNFGGPGIWSNQDADEQPLQSELFQCRASGIRALIIELPIANPPAAPCVEDHHALVIANVGLGLLASLRTGVMEVNTNHVFHQRADADATTANVNLSLGLVGFSLKASLVHSEVATTCTSGNAASNASTQLVGVLLNGNPINVNGPVSIPIPLVGTLHLGWQGYIAGRLTARGIWLDTPLVPGGVVISESFTSIYHGPCPGP